MEPNPYRGWTPQKGILAFVGLMGLGSMVYVLATDLAWGEPPSTYGDVQLILDRNCTFCHNFKGPNAKALTTSHAELTRGTRAIVVPGNVAKSKLSKVIHGTGPSKMPPGRSLSRREIASIDAWIAAGAKP
jgi:hypothetical protein